MDSAADPQRRMSRGGLSARHSRFQTRCVVSAKVGIGLAHRRSARVSIVVRDRAVAIDYTHVPDLSGAGIVRLVMKAEEAVMSHRASIL